MKLKVALPLVVAVLVAACGGGGPAGGTNRPPTAMQPSGGGPGVKVDCAAIEAAAQKLVGIQLLAQLSSPQTIESIKSLGTLDLEALLSALEDLHALDGVASPLGDARASIDAYEAAAEAARDLFEMEPVTQAAIDAYNEEHVGSITEFLGKQLAISGAVGEAGC